MVVGRDATAKRFLLLALLTGACASAVVLSASEWMLRTSVQPNDAVTRQLSLYRQADRLELVAFGDSHLSQDFVATEGMLNLAMSGEGLPSIVTKLRQVLAHRHPRRVVLQLSPQMFADYRDQQVQHDYEALLADPPSLPALALLDPVYRSRLLDYWSHWLGGGSFERRWPLSAGGSVLSDLSMGAGGTALWRYHTRARVELHTPPERFRTSASAAHLEQSLELVESARVDACVVTLPVTPEYQRLAAERPTFQQSLDFIRGRAQAHGLGYFSYWSRYSNRGLFRNQDHLNREGAERLTRALLDDCFGVKHRP